MEKILEITNSAQKFRDLNLIMFTKPNTMNNYGYVLEELGLKQFLVKFQINIMQKLGNWFFNDWSYEFDDLHAFSIKYKDGEDLSLDNHMDMSELTLNMCLGTDFEGGELLVKNQREQNQNQQYQFTVEQQIGSGFLHAGQHWHGSQRIKKGERINFVFWSRSSKFRGSVQENFYYICKNKIEKQGENLKNLKFDL
ncbi:hypothetical protein PPERSA_11545 [Pseudocohnilembus persalinus]|uniref:Fe2OG dioxygenase domain-containing protein n=1 Tax=Pseudocohnilembus persalinus TaxID=266149 RepID=A0A0V0QXH9_PSEPJ|nr:hypothetical protein PPERSA_11545 [Pseudocohnilembus persalinus]|eukprot:KRX06900.1 hypothetical protein PPERSA_11545 [Pseudocohnilembus persalinus]